MYIALKPIKFDRQYEAGEKIEDGKVLSSVVHTLVSSGYITVAPDTKTSEPKEITEDSSNKENNSEVTEVEKVIEPSLNEEDTRVKDGFDRKTLETMSKSELQDLLKVNGVEFKKSDTKEELINNFLRG